MSETKHTPGPWRIGRSRQGKLPTLQPPAIKVGNEYVAVLGGGSIHFANADANAEYICRACNSHDDLLAALRVLRNAYGSMEGICDALIMADAAIAKAEGR